MESFEVGNFVEKTKHDQHNGCLYCNNDVEQRTGVIIEGTIVSLLKVWTDCGDVVDYSECNVKQANRVDGEIRVNEGFIKEIRVLK